MWLNLLFFFILNIFATAKLSHFITASMAHQRSSRSTSRAFRRSLFSRRKFHKLAMPVLCTVVSAPVGKINTRGHFHQTPRISVTCFAAYRGGADRIFIFACWASAYTTRVWSAHFLLPIIVIQMMSSPAAALKAQVLSKPDFPASHRRGIDSRRGRYDMPGMLVCSFLPPSFYDGFLCCRSVSTIETANLNAARAADANRAICRVRPAEAVIFHLHDAF